MKILSEKILSYWPKIEDEELRRITEWTQQQGLTDEQQKELYKVLTIDYKWPPRLAEIIGSWNELKGDYTDPIECSKEYFWNKHRCTPAISICKDIFKLRAGHFDENRPKPLTFAQVSYVCAFDELYQTWRLLIDKNGDYKWTDEQATVSLEKVKKTLINGDQVGMVRIEDLKISKIK